MGWWGTPHGGTTWGEYDMLEGALGLGPGLNHHMGGGGTTLGDMTCWREHCGFSFPWTVALAPGTTWGLMGYEIHSCIIGKCNMREVTPQLIVLFGPSFKPFFSPYPWSQQRGHSLSSYVVQTAPLSTLLN